LVVVVAPGRDTARIAKMAFTSADRVRNLIENFNEDGFESLQPGGSVKQLISMLIGCYLRFRAPDGRFRCRG